MTKATTKRLETTARKILGPKATKREVERLARKVAKSLAARRAARG